MTAQSPSLGSDNESNIRKRVCKACDRCRLKKSKCDGSNPCNRCRTDNAICVFGERKKSHDKVYPKGYVEMLERQQQQLVNGLQELYEIVITQRGWNGAPLQESMNGHPLTHDILERLGALKLDANVETEAFEDNLNVLRQKLVADGVFSSRNSSTGQEYQSQGLFPESTSPKHYLSDSFPILTQFPPTPPFQTPHETTSMGSPESTNIATDLNTSLLPSQQSTWVHPQPAAYDEGMDFLRFETPSEFLSLHSMEEPMSPWLDDDPNPFELNTGMT